MSARSVQSSPTIRPKVTISHLRSLAAAKTPITVLTAYDYPTALLSESAGTDIVLIGDSLSQVALGHESTTEITLDEMIHHAKAVTRGAKTAFIIADLPFGSFEVSVQQGVKSALRMVKEGGVDGVKIEGGDEILPLVKKLVSIGIPVMPHIGLLPQRATSTSGYLVQGRSSFKATKLMETAVKMEEAGATLMLIEAVPHLLASYITAKVDIPVIGIGAGPGTNGQVLVITDVLGTYASNGEGEGEGQEGQGEGMKRHKPKPKFVRWFGDAGAQSSRAVGAYLEAVRTGTFPEVGKETYGFKKEEWDGFLRAVGESGDVVGGKRVEGKVGEETEDGA